MPRGIPTFYKDANEVADYVLTWNGTRGLDTGDTIASSTWTVGTGITKDSSTNTTTTTTIWLSGGTTGTKYTCTNRVVTAGGRTFDQSIYVVIRAA